MNSQYLPRFNAETCTDCGGCEKICPGKAISTTAGIRTVNEKLCVGCGLCEYHCPESAIELEEARESPFAKDRGIFHHFIIYLSCYLVLAPHFIIYMLLKGPKRKRAREIEW